MNARPKTSTADLRAFAPIAPPSGMRDLLYPESSERRALGARLLATFAQYGYELVTTPPFELADVMERGLGTIDRRDLMRFVEPDTGEVALLRPDITPQVARIIATRLNERPAPYRLCYDGSVIRRRRGRARKQKQIAQAGVECVGIAGASGDVEVVSLAVKACRNVGLSDFRVELGHVAIGLSALSTIADKARPLAAEALARKDQAELLRILKTAGASAKDRARITALTVLDGDLSVLKDARRLFTSAWEKKALSQLTEVATRLTSLGVGDSLGVDLGDVRRASYYTGVSFTILAEGPGEPIGAGGRYDNLLAQFDRPLPATGFGLDVDHLEWALAHAKVASLSLPMRVVVVGKDARALEKHADGLREAQISAAVLGNVSAKEGLAFAEAWHYDAVLLVEAKRVRIERVRDKKAEQFVVHVSRDGFRAIDESTSIADKVKSFVQKVRG